MIFTSEQIDALVTALPGCVDPHRRALLPQILQEWGRTDLDEHLKRATPDQIRAERRRMERVARRAGELALALSDLGPDERFTVARLLVPVTARIGKGEPSYEQTLEAVRNLGDEPTRLQHMARAATDAAAGWVPMPLRHGTVIRYRVLQDLAAIFEWATGERAGRRIRTDIAEDAGKPYGPFWEFARTAWPIVFGSTRGLSNAVKFWALGRGKYGEISPFIANLALSYPEWRIFER